MNPFIRAASSKIVLFNLITTLVEISAVIEGVIPPKYLIYTTTAKSVLTVILRVWFNSNVQPAPFPEKAEKENL